MCYRKLFGQVEGMLHNSTWFKRSKGADHVVVATHFFSKTRLQPFSAIQSCHWVSYLTNIKTTKAGRLRIAKTFVGHKNPPAPAKTRDIAFIASLHPERQTVKGRRNACKWLKHQTGPNNWTIKACGAGQQCPTPQLSRMHRWACTSGGIIKVRID